MLDGYIIASFNAIMLSILKAGLIIILFTILPFLIPRILSFFSRIRFYRKKKRRNDVNFTKVDDYKEILKQEKFEEEQLQIDMDVLSENIYRINARAIDADTPEAYDQARRDIKKLKRDIKNFRFVDSIKFEKNKIVEGNEIEELKEYGNSYDIELFKEWCKGIFKYIKIGKKEELEVIKYFLDEQLYENFIEQTQKYESDGLKFVTENLKIKECTIFDYGQWMEKEEIKVLIKAEMKEFIVQESTNRILRGSKNKIYEKNILMTFIKQDITEKEGIISLQSKTEKTHTHIIEYK